MRTIRTKDNLKIEGDARTSAQFEAFLAAIFARYLEVISPEASLYVCHESVFQREFQAALETAGFEIRTQIIWAKNTFGWGFARYKFQHEPIFYCHVAGKKDANRADRNRARELQPARRRRPRSVRRIRLHADLA